MSIPMSWAEGHCHLCPLKNEIKSKDTLIRNEIIAVDQDEPVDKRLYVLCFDR